MTVLWSEFIEIMVKTEYEPCLASFTLYYVGDQQRQPFGAPDTWCLGTEGLSGQAQTGAPSGLSSPLLLGRLVPTYVPHT